MGVFGSVFGFNKPKKRFNQSAPSEVKLQPSDIKKIVKRTYMRTVDNDQKEGIIKELLTEKYDGGITELELRRVLKSLFYKKEISRTDYNKLIRTFQPYYSGKKNPPRI